MMIKQSICCLLLLIARNYGQFVMEVNDTCYIGSTKGKCTKITECEVALKRISQLIPHNLTRCGFSGLEEIVCCESKVSDENANDYVVNAPKPPLKIDNKASDVPARSRADVECDNIKPRLPLSTASYIVGGENAFEGEFPHMVGILLYNKVGEYYKLVCGGSLITETWVLTGAHCILETVNYKLNIGSLTSGEGKELNNKTTFDIKSIHIHPNYNRRVKYYDIALIELQRPVPITPTSYPACLYTSKELPDSKVIVSGWGATDMANARTSQNLIKATLTIIPNSVCRDQYKIARPLPDGITENQMCAADYEHHRDTCMGDSGGPLQIVNPIDGVYRIVGVTSFGKLCGTDAGGVYTRVASYVPWIESIIWPTS